MTTTLLIADAANLPAVVREPLAGLWAAMEAPTLDAFKLADLRFILQKLPPDGAAVDRYRQSFRSLDDADEYDDDALFVVPQDLVQLLASLPDERLAETAVAWTKTPEARRARWVAEDVEPFLGDLSDFARRALEEEKLLLLFVQVSG